MPVLKKGSSLKWCPVITRVCTFPIDEEIEYDEELHGMLHCHRPLFYNELNASRIKEMEKRFRMSKRKRRKNGKDTSPEKPKRTGRDVSPEIPKRSIEARIA